MSKHTSESISYLYGDELDEAVKELAPAEGYTMKPNRSDWELLAYCVNEGIDSHLEGFTKSSFDNPTGEVLIHPEELHILVRRLSELSEGAGNFKDCILETLVKEEE